MSNTPEKKIREVSSNDLPVCCPEAGEKPGELHPRVFIPLKKKGEIEVCPYCGQEFLLKD